MAYGQQCNDAVILSSIIWISLFAWVAGRTEWTMKNACYWIIEHAWCSKLWAILMTSSAIVLHSCGISQSISLHSVTKSLKKKDVKLVKKWCIMQNKATNHTKICLSTEHFYHGIGKLCIHASRCQYIV